MFEMNQKSLSERPLPPMTCESVTCIVAARPFVPLKDVQTFARQPTQIVQRNFASAFFPLSHPTHLDDTFEHMSTQTLMSVSLAPSSSESSLSRNGIIVSAVHVRHPNNSKGCHDNADNISSALSAMAAMLPEPSKAINPVEISYTTQCPAALLSLKDEISRKSRPTAVDPLARPDSPTKRSSIGFCTQYQNGASYPLKYEAVSRFGLLAVGDFNGYGAWETPSSISSAATDSRKFWEVAFTTAPRDSTAYGNGVRRRQSRGKRMGGVTCTALSSSSLLPCADEKDFVRIDGAALILPVSAVQSGATKDANIECSLSCSIVERPH